MMRLGNTVGVFQSTLSVRRATGAGIDKYGVLEISIHALRKESDWTTKICNYFHAISIHALRKESDDMRPTQGRGRLISIHALRKESDNITRPLELHFQDFNPRSP